MLSHILITVMCMQLLHVLHIIAALAQARPTMSCIPLVAASMFDCNLYLTSPSHSFGLPLTLM